MRKINLTISLVLENKRLQDEKKLRYEVARRTYTYWYEKFLSALAEEPGAVKVDRIDPLTKKRSLVRGRVELVLMTREELERALSDSKYAWLLRRELKTEEEGGDGDETTTL